MNQDLAQSLCQLELKRAQSLFSREVSLAFIPCYNPITSQHLILITSKDNPSLETIYSLQTDGSREEKYQPMLRGLATILTLAGFDIYIPVAPKLSLPRLPLLQEYLLEIFVPDTESPTIAGFSLEDAYLFLGIKDEHER